jgi:hypothetical protein
MAIDGLGRSCTPLKAVTRKSVDEHGRDWSGNAE